MVSKIEFTNYLEYISNEEYNLLTSLRNFGKEFFLFSELDFIYKEYFKILQSLKVKPNYEAVISIFLYFIHFNFYFSTSCFMRGHTGEAFSSIRKSIDAGFTAYYILENKDSVEDYINQEKYFIYIKNTIKKIRESDKTKYPLAQGLIELHELCSSYASHADISSFINRIVIEKDKIGFNYFTIPEDKNTFKLYFVVGILSFYYLFRIFKNLFIDIKTKGIVVPDLQIKYNSLEGQLQELKKKYYENSKNT